MNGRWSEAVVSHGQRVRAGVPLLARLALATTVGALFVAVYALPAYAGSPWHSPVSISKPKQGAMLSPDVAISNTGEAIAVWQRAGNEKLPVIQSASRPAGGAWSAPINISPMGARLKSFGPQIAIDAAGEAVAVWAFFKPGHNMVIQSATRLPNGTWSEPITLSRTPGEVQSPQIVIGATGEAAAAWDVFFDSQDWIVQTATRAPDGTWSAPIGHTARGVESNGSRIAMNDAGEAVLVWDTSLGRSRTVTKVASRPPGGSWSAPVKLTEARGNEILFPHIAIGPTGEAIAFWDRIGLGEGDDTLIQSASRPAGGSWSAPTDVSASHGDSEDPAIAIGPSGEAVAVWVRSVRKVRARGHRELIQSASRPPGGVWSAPIDVFSARVYELVHPTIAIGAAGDAVAVWQNEQAAIQSASRSPLGAWSAASSLYRERANQTLFPEIAIAPGGETVAVWQTPYGIQSAFRTPGGPPAVASAGGLPARMPREANDQER